MSANKVKDASLSQRVRQWFRKVIGRTRFDDLDRRVETLHGQQTNAEEHLSELVRQVEERLVRLHEANGEDVRNQGRAGEQRHTELLERHDGIDLRLEDLLERSGQMGTALGRIEERGGRIGDVLTNAMDLLDRLRVSHENFAEVLTRLDNRVLRYCEITDRVDANLLRSAEKVSLLLAKLEETIGNLHDRDERILKEVSLVEELRERADRAEACNQDLADQAAHLIDALGQARKEMRGMRERSDAIHEVEASRADLERDLENTRSELEALRSESAELHAASETFQRWKASFQSEIDRIARERDRLLMEAKSKGLEGNGSSDSREKAKGPRTASSSSSRRKPGTAPQASSPRKKGGAPEKKEKDD